MLIRLRVECFRAVQIAVRNLQREIGRRVPRDASAVRIEARPVEIVTVLIRLAAGENRALDLHVFPREAERRDA